MSERTVAPFGAWKSPITSELIVADTVGLGAICLDGDDSYWLESRPTEGGRLTLVRREQDGRIGELTPAPFNVRTRVHEYGGGSYTVRNGTAFFANFADQRWYRRDPDGTITPISPDLPNAELRYANPAIDWQNRQLICVREDHRTGDQDAINTLVALDMDGGSFDDGGTVLVSGNDFYASPALSPDGTRLAWLTWNHPNMPWDGCELWLGDLAADGRLEPTVCLAGGGSESIFQPVWSPAGDLCYVSDRTGWWNLYRDREGTAEPLAPMAAEFGVPQWVFGMSTYGFAAPNTIVCTYTERGDWRVATLDLETKQLTPLDLPDTDFDDIQAGNGFAVFAAAAPALPWAIVRLEIATGTLELLRLSSDVTIDPGYLSVPEAIEFPTGDGLTAHGFYYPPANKDFTGPQGELPPLIVVSHGGPTGSTSSALSLGRQYWTSRGFAMLDVNYGGSTGYGREYRERLNDRWGIVDVDDCVNGARSLVEQGVVDPNRLAIRGGSASGYTTLAALTFRDVFKAGGSHFGISDLEAMAKDTHKFESRYLDGLIGPYPERRGIYVARSPIHFVERLSCPLILFQGLEDKVVPPNQAEMMYDAVRAKGIPVAYVPFEGEQHGFRQAKNIRRSLDGELYFLSRVFGFSPADQIEPVPIVNLPERR